MISVYSLSINTLPVINAITLSVSYYYYYYRLLRTKQHMNNYTMEISGTITTLK